MSDLERLKSLLARIESGEATLSIDIESSFCGAPEYSTEGWKFQVFDDCDEWDYFEWVETPEGLRINSFPEPYHEHDEHYTGHEICIECFISWWRPKNHKPWGYED